MPFIAVILLGLSLWALAELAAFALVAHVIGVAGALLVTLLTSLFGMAVLRRLGESARKDLTSIIARSDGPIKLSLDALRSGVFAALGAVLLIMPGFISDCVGLFLAAPALRRIEPLRRNSVPPEVVDLSPRDWQRVDNGDRR